MDVLDSTLPAGLRLAPLDRPRGILQRLLWWLFRLRYGKVMMAQRVVYPRIPRFTLAQVAMVSFAHYGLSLDPTLRNRIDLRVSAKHGCSFCGDLAGGIALMEGFPPELLEDAEAPLDDERFDAATRAALAYVDAIDEAGNVDDATFDALRAHFDERQIVEIVWLNAFTTYHNLLAKPLGLRSDGFCALARGEASEEGSGVSSAPI